MPRRNTDRSNPEQWTTFHVYNRGKNKNPIFIDDFDRLEFMSCLKRHLTSTEVRDQSGRPYRKLGAAIELQCFCLMPNHYHLFVRELIPGARALLIKSAIGGYVRYFNRRHRRSGPLFAGPFREVAIKDGDQYRQAVKYIHENHPEGPTYRFCSHSQLVGSPRDWPSWIGFDSVLRAFGGRDQYLAYMRGQG